MNIYILCICINSLNFNRKIKYLIICKMEGVYNNFFTALKQTKIYFNSSVFIALRNKLGSLSKNYLHSFTIHSNAAN